MERFTNKGFKFQKLFLLLFDQYYKVEHLACDTNLTFIIQLQDTSKSN